MKIMLTWRMKKQVHTVKAMDELNEINNFDLWEHLSAYVSILPRILLQLFQIQNTVVFPILK